MADSYHDAAEDRVFPLRDAQARSAACEHDWRHLRTWTVENYSPAPDPHFTTVAIKQTVTTTTYDEWYCTKCRRIEAMQRV